MEPERKVGKKLQRNAKSYRFVCMQTTLSSFHSVQTRHRSCYSAFILRYSMAFCFILTPLFYRRRWMHILCRVANHDDATKNESEFTLKKKEAETEIGVGSKYWNQFDARHWNSIAG